MIDAVIKEIMGMNFQFLCRAGTNSTLLLQIDAWKQNIFKITLDSRILSFPNKRLVTLSGICIVRACLVSSSATVILCCFVVSA